jgi:hypothetical protein
LVGELLKIYWKNNFKIERTDTPQILIVLTNKNPVVLGWGACRSYSWSTSTHLTSGISMIL